ncbi:MAG TPA: CoA transferase [Candidatus Binatia bacterium]|nr:CoA transferase [Candidatus Binatia bacterium]
MPSLDAPLSGIRVVDLSQGIAGPYCAMLLAQHGADVVKVEPPEGDWSRTLGARYGDQTAFSVVGNLGKRAIALDLKGEDDRAILRRLAARADVFIEGFRPGVAARLGVDYPAIAALSPRVVYLSVSGFGQTGPERERPAMDPVLQAFTGMMHRKSHAGRGRANAFTGKIHTGTVPVKWGAASRPRRRGGSPRSGLTSGGS